jgi:tetratricopeptide (TPR) repeat protein/TolB-like protein
MIGGLTARSPLAVLALIVVTMVPLVWPAGAAAKPKAILILPFDATALSADERWLGNGVAEVLTLGLAQHPAFVQIERSRLRALGEPEAWGESVVLSAARQVRADAALFGRLARKDGALVVQPRLLELRQGGQEPGSLEPLTMPDDEFLTRIGTLPVMYVRALRVGISEAEGARIDKAAHPTRSLRAFELYTRGQAAVQRAGQEANESAVDLLSRAIEADPNFVMAQYALGAVHQTLGNRWKAAAQFRAATQIDPTQPEPLKALGDLFLAAPRRLYDQAVEAYAKAIELRPFYADAYVGLGEAKAAKGDVDGAIGAYQKALLYNPVNPRVHLSLGKIYYSEKGLYYEAVNAYKHAIDLDPLSVDGRMGLGEVYEDKGLYKEAIEEYRRVIELDGKHSGAMYNLASVYEKVDPQEAIAQWERYIALASQLPSEKDWVDVARQHLRKLKNTLKE